MLRSAVGLVLVGALIAGCSGADITGSQPGASATRTPASRSASSRPVRPHSSDPRSSATPQRPDRGGRTVSSRALLRALPVAPVHRAGYDRDLFPLWIDADHDGCDTRDEVLIAEATKAPHVGTDCALTGGTWRSPCDGVVTHDPSSFDIDHLVPLAEAWSSGAWRWTTATRQAYANDLGYAPDLVAVTAHSNRSKGDDQPMDYLPPRTAFDCTYEAWWVAVKWRWHLRVDRAEKRWLTAHLHACKWPTLSRPSRPVIHSGGHGGHPPKRHGARITSVFFDPPGSDDGGNASLNGEWVEIENSTTHRVVLTGWTLHDTGGHAYTFGRFGLAAGAAVRVHTGRGQNTRRNRYWSLTDYVWNNDGDTATLQDADGGTVDRCAYTSSDDPRVTC